MTKEAPPGASVTIIGLLLWAERGKRTLDEAEASGRTLSPGWRFCANEGFIAVNDGMLSLTEAGKSFLTIERFTA